MSNGEAQIAIENGKLAIFASRMGFAGPVVQNYMPFDEEAAAIEEAKKIVAARGLELDPVICRPVITSMRVSYGRRRKSG
jgi:hypothetical protein